MTAEHDLPSDAPVTVLFTAVQSSTALHASVVDSEARRILDDYEGLVQRELQDHGGTLVRSLGDGLLATFPSATRAVACAVTIQRAVKDLRLQRPEYALGVRVGINAGEVIVSDRDVYGTAVDAAACIGSEANPGQVLVADVVRQLLEPNPDVLVREWRHVALEGLPGRWLLHEVVWQPVTVAERASPPPPETTLVGRDEVLELLERVLEQALDGQSQLALICGEAGIGKTAVARALGALAVRRGARVAWSATWEGAGATAFWPWIQVLRTVSGETEWHLREEIPRALRGELAQLLRDVGTPEGDAVDDPDQSRLRLFEGVAQVLQAVTAKEPLVVVLDDLHWADAASLLLLSFLSRRVVDHPLLFLATTRDPEDEADDTSAHLLNDLLRHGTVVALTGLAPDETALLVRRTLGTDPGSNLARALHDRTGGNPFFVRELARLAGAQVGRATLPEGVRDVIERRLARLPQPCADLLGAAAVVGRQFDPGLLAAITGRSLEEVLTLLDEAARARVLDDRPGPLGPYRFAHDLFRETLYEDLGTSRRAELHLTVGDTLSAGDERSAERVADVAHHLSQALPLATPTRVVEACQSAAVSAVARLAFEDAARWYEQALSALQLPDSTTDRRIDLLLRLADAQRRAAQRSAAGATYQRLLELARRAERTDVVAEAALGIDAMAIPSYVEDHVHRALLQEALAAVGAEDSPLRARLLASLARFELHGGMRWGDPQVLGLTNDALAVAKRLGDPAILAFCLLAHHDAMWDPSTARDRVAVATEMAEAAAAASDTERLFEARNLRLAALLELAEPEAELELQGMVALASDAHQPRLHYYALTRQAMWAALRGDLDAAAHLTEEGKKLGDSIGEPDAGRVWLGQWIGLQVDRGPPWTFPRGSVPREWEADTSAQGLRRAALVKWNAGDREGAAHILTRLGEDGLAAGIVGPLVGVSSFLLAHVCIELQLTNTCRQLYGLLARHAGLCMVGAGAIGFYGSFDHHLGLLAVAIGERRAAVEHFEAALPLHDRMGARGWVARSKVALGELLMDSEPGRARQLLEQGEAIAEAVGMEWLAIRAVVARRGGHEMAIPAFSRQGSIWTVTFLGDSVQLPHTKGLQDIAHLVQCAGEEVHAAELVGLADSGADEVLDEPAKLAYRDRLIELDAEIDDAETANDLERAAKASEERAMLLDQLETALGLGGRSRRLGDPVERARKAVGGRIHAAIARISERHEPLGNHLASTVRTGTYCSYRPGE